MKGYIDRSVLFPLLFHSFFMQLCIAMLRVTTSYRVLELDLPVVWLGLISGTFALLPVFLAVSVGRFIDRGNDARAAWIGSSLVVGPAILFYFWPGTPFLLLIYTLLLGVGHLFIMASHQMLCVRAGGDHGRDFAFGNFTVAQALGQGCGPLIIGWIGGAARIPETHFLFGIATAGSILAMLIGFSLRPIDSALRRKRDEPHIPVLELLRIDGLIAILAASVISITASDLLPIYLPLLGTERNIDVSQIGTILSVRAAASIASRMGYASVVQILGRKRMTVYSMILSGVGFLCLAAPMPIWGLYIAAVIVGLGLGVASTISITSIVDLVPIQARGTAMTLRITGNRVGQVLVPLAGSFIAALSGAAGMLGIIAVSLIGSGLSVHAGNKNKRQVK